MPSGDRVPGEISVQRGNRVALSMHVYSGGRFEWLATVGLRRVPRIVSAWT